MTRALTRAAVIGTGHLGTFHAEKYAAIEDCELVAVVDSDADRARALADRDDLDAEAIAAKAMNIAAGICVYTNTNIIIEKLNAK